MPTLMPLAALSALFVCSHFLLSWTPLRERLARSLGEIGFLAVYSLLALVSLAGAAHAYAKAPQIPLWDASPGLRVLPLLVMAPAFLLVIGGLTQPNPAAVMQGASLDRLEAPRGMLSVTRHPTMWGIALWGISHGLANGDAASLILMGSVAFLALAGSAHIDMRRRVRLGPAWDRWEKTTSFLPFQAMVGGRARLELADLGWWRPLLALALYGAMLHLHPTLFGASPLP